MEKSAKQVKKEAREEKQKDQKIEDQVLKSLEVAATPEEKFQLLLRKHVECERNSRRTLSEVKVQEKQLETVLREKENLQREYNKSVLMRDKLQEVCREQQKIIKSVKNESLAKIREEEERRKESQSKFQSSLNEITVSLNKNNEENLKLRDHNIEMTKKLKFLAEQYQIREQQLEKLNEQVQLESQLHQVKLNKVIVESTMEKEILVKEKQIALEKLLQKQQIIKELCDREAELKEQLNLYTAKYDDFQNSLQKSNDIFTTYKQEIDKMTKHSKKQEKELFEWKRKWEKCNASLIELATEKKDRDDHAMRCNKQVEQLQKLLRALQSERTHLYKVMRENNVECPAMPALPPEPEPIKTTGFGSSTDRDKMEMMTKNCAELKETLANLQSQMKFLNLKETATPKPEESINAQQRDEKLKKRQNKKKQKVKANKKAANDAHDIKESSPTSSTASQNGNANGEEVAVEDEAQKIKNNQNEAVQHEQASIKESTSVTETSNESSALVSASEVQTVVVEASDEQLSTAAAQLVCAEIVEAKADQISIDSALTVFPANVVPNGNLPSVDNHSAKNDVQSAGNEAEVQLSTVSKSDETPANDETVAVSATQIVPNKN